MSERPGKQAQTVNGEAVGVVYLRLTPEEAGRLGNELKEILRHPRLKITFELFALVAALEEIGSHRVK